MLKEVLKKVGSNVTGIFKFTEDERSGGVFMKAGDLFGGVSVFFTSSKLNKYFYRNNTGIRVIFKDATGHKWKLLLERSK